MLKDNKWIEVSPLIWKKLVSFNLHHKSAWIIGDIPSDNLLLALLTPMMRTYER